MLEFSTQRRSGKVFPSRDNYLSEKTKADGSAEYTSGPWLCHAMAREYVPFVDTQGHPMGKGVSRYFPWLTLILGSGCSNELATRQDIDVLPPSTIGRLLERQPLLPDGTAPSDLAKSFAELLIEDRLAADYQSLGNKARHRPRENDQATNIAKLVLAAALLTQLYNETAAATRRPLRQWGEHSVSLVDGPQSIPEIRHCWQSPLLNLCRDLRPHSDAVNKLIQEIIKQLSDSTTRSTVEYLHVQLLTDYAWNGMAPNAPPYPGWSELLVHLYQSQKQTQQLPIQCPPKPWFLEANTVETRVAERFLDATTRSWAENRNGAQSDIGRFFRSVAGVLEAQTHLQQKYPEAQRPPVPAVFLTSFDLELEMALARTQVPGFVMALPVNLYYGTGENGRALSFWIGALVRRKHFSRLESLLSPTEWFVLKDDALLYADWEKWPWVVRLTGSPMVKLPLLVETTEEDERISPNKLSVSLKKLFNSGSVPTGATMRHALLLDEYAAMQQQSTDIEMPGKSANGSPGYGRLPSILAGITERVSPRFWMALGVQMNDTCIRYRVASRLGAAPRRQLETSSAEQPEQPPQDQSKNRRVTAGLLVTRHVDAAARDLMQWYGLDVVKSDCRDYIGDLDRYQRHLVDDASHLFSDDCRAVQGQTRGRAASNPRRLRPHEPARKKKGS